MTQPKFSILIPAYNAEAFIDQTLESVLDQRYKNIEVIVRNDGSTDQTLEKMGNFSPQVAILDGPNIGPAKGRNLLFEASQGDIIHFHDADDLLHPDYCEAIVETFARNPDCDVVVNNIQHIGKGAPPSQTNHTQEAISQDPPGYMLSHLIQAAVANYRREALLQFDPLFDHRFTRAEDWELNLRIAALGGKFAVCPSVLKSCVRRKNSFSSNSLYCTIAIAHMYCYYVGEFLPAHALDAKTWAAQIAPKLYDLGDRLGQEGYPSNAREIWGVAEHLDPAYRFGNRGLDLIKGALGIPWGFLVWGVKRNPIQGLKALLDYALRSRKAPVRLEL